MKMTVSDNTQKLLSCLGLCARARKIVFGVPMVCDAMKKGGASKPLLVLEARDTSENTHKRITDKCRFYNVRLVRIECTGETLAAALGKSSALGAVALTDANFCAMVEKYTENIK